MKKKAVIIANVGTPDNYSTKAVASYLREFLGDKRVITLPWILRKLLVNFIIVPFRKYKSSEIYKELWDDNGSPLRYITESLTLKLNEKLNPEIDVFYAMRYGNPSISEVISKVHDKYSEILVFPMFPQYASSTTGTVLEEVFDTISNMNIIPKIRYIDQFYDNPNFVNTFAQKISSYDLSSYDALVFTYHGLPISHINDCHPLINIQACTCDKDMPKHGTKCYRATCYETTRLLCSKLNLENNIIFTSFQSRLDNNWLKPFTDELLSDLVGKNQRKVLLIAPSFTVDCLETIVELGYEYRNHFISQGGEVLDLVPCLNDDDIWINSMISLIHEELDR
ncbi:ferrochelatase [Candidatus Kapaibacterium sp.]